MPLRSSRPSRFARRGGFSILELTLAVLMVSILSMSAFIGYLHLSEDAKMSSVKKDLRHFREALRLYNEDHFQSPYALNDPTALSGRYLSSIPKDPWYAEFIIDPFLGRIVSRGPNGVLDANVVGFVESAPPAGGVADDVTEIYQPQGNIGCTVGTGGHLYKLDGVIGGGEVVKSVDSFGICPDRDTAAIAAGGKLKILRISLSEVKTDDVATLPATLAELTVSHDNRRWAGIDSSRRSLWVGPLRSVTEGGVAPSVLTSEVPFVLFAVTTDTLSAPSWSRDMQELAVATSGGEVWRLVVGAGAQKTVLASNAARDVEKNAPSWSADGKWIAYAGSAMGKIEVVSPTARAAPFSPVDVSCFSGGGAVGPVAWSPVGQKLALVAGKALWLVDVGADCKVQAPQKALSLDVTGAIVPAADVTGARGLGWR